MKILVTGATGFIGSAFVRYILQNDTNNQLDVLALRGPTQRRNLRRLDAVKDSHRLQIKSGDLRTKLRSITEGMDVVVHFAAKTFVNESIRDPAAFVETNVLGTMHLLEDARRSRVPRFIQISTDEVYGQILSGAHKEDAAINPRNPYAASKAGADALVLAYGATYKIHVTIVRTENNYGPYQQPEKVIPAFVQRALAGEKLPVYGDGQHARQWLWVDDHAEALTLLLNSNYPSGEIFHIAGNEELRNVELAKEILAYLNKPTDQIEFINDDKIRPGHDRRYALSSEKIRKLGWKPKVGLEEGLKRAVEWYWQNPWWFT
jgi:dTDP-glucose 4,6-dehydratase